MVLDPVPHLTSHGNPPGVKTDLMVALEGLDRLVLAKTGNRLSELQRTILVQVWQGQTYLQIAERYGCTEGHAKDVGSDLWKLLSDLLGDRISKKNMRVVLPRYLKTLPEQIPAPANTEALNFVGRTGAIAHLEGLIRQGAKIIVIQGEGGLGKTTLAQHYLQSQGFELVLELLMAKESQTITPAERVVEEWLKSDFQEEPGLEFGITLERLKRHLRRRRVGILIDNLEPTLDAQGQFPEDHLNYVELLRVLSDPQSQGTTFVTSRDRLCEPAVTVHHYRLPGLDLNAWEQFFEGQQIAIHPSTLQAMHHAYGGNAKVMGILAGTISADYDNDMEIYWQQSHQALLTSMDLKNLVDSQINRLQILDCQAYALFCRLGCYRYQDIPTLPLEGILAQLWDIPMEQQRSAVTALQNRSLIEFRKGEYSLHPVLREAAITRLRSGPDWQLSHETAAAYWSESVGSIHTVPDALQALEAYYHYLAIQDYRKAGRVLLKSRHNQWNQYLPLGSTLYRMGLVQPVLGAIPVIVDHLQGDYTLSELYNLLGDGYWITGQVHDAIRVQEVAVALSSQALAALEAGPDVQKSHYYYTMLGVDSRFSIGLYCLDLWELERAKACFQQVIDQVKDTPHARWERKASVCLALTLSYLGLTELAQHQADLSYESILVEKQGSSAYFIQLLGLAYVNLGRFERAETLFILAWSYTKTSQYTQIKAKTLMGMALMDRHQRKDAQAIANHQQAITLLEQMGAKCDLAEAYYQLGLTYRAFGRQAESEQVLQQAIALFEGMQAPLQIKKIMA